MTSALLYHNPICRPNVILKLNTKRQPMANGNEEVENECMFLRTSGEDTLFFSCIICYFLYTSSVLISFLRARSNGSLLRSGRHRRHSTTTLTHQECRKSLTRLKIATVAKVLFDFSFIQMALVA